MNTFKDHRKGWALVIIMSLVSFGIGYMVGYGEGLNVCVTAAKKLLDIQFKPEAWAEIIRRYPEVLSYIK